MQWASVESFRSNRLLNLYVFSMSVIFNLDINWIKCILYSFSIVLSGTGILIIWFPKWVPGIVKRAFLYGKTSRTMERQKVFGEYIVHAIEMPKR